ncbi:MAG: NAD(P)/FAD-dependent oxidoreductase [Halobacteriovoraceae bacterium]|nr:NAD(P)/FAD-dependent oxidoreductase [Halobacteriovoraceae bacterium]
MTDKSDPKNKIHDLAIIGAGAAGIMAALRGVLNNDEVLLFGGTGKDKKRSRAQWVGKVENIPGFTIYEKGINDPNKETLKFIGESEFSENLTHLKNVGIENIEKDESLNLFILSASDGEVYKAKYVVLATGVMDVQPKIEGTIKKIFPYANVQSVDYCIRCDGHHVKGKETAIIGDGESAAWIAILLHERYQPPHLTVITDGAKPEYSEKVKKLLEIYKIQVIEKGLDGVRGDEKTGKLEGFYFCDGTYQPIDFAFVSMGMLVYNQLAQGLKAEVDERGFVKTNEKGESNIPGLYIAGDLRANTKKQIYTAWDTAVDSVDDINNKLRSEKREEYLKQYS